jgi:hypothetical protein
MIGTSVEGMKIMMIIMTNPLYGCGSHYKRLLELDKSRRVPRVIELLMKNSVNSMISEDKSKLILVNQPYYSVIKYDLLRLIYTKDNELKYANISI